MTEFDPERFEDKYTEYFTELEQAYRNAFDTMNERYDSELVHAIDQLVLSESEPFYLGDGEFDVDLPDDALDRIAGFGDERTRSETLDRFREEIEDELRAIFEFE